MPLTLSGVLDPEALADLRALAASLAWADGRSTAGPTARAVKRNEQARLEEGAGAVLRERVLESLRAHPVFAAAARPARFSALLLSRMREGQGYGTHIDNPLMGSGRKRLRADLSFTLFVSPPEAYDGGVLEVEGPGAVHALKPAAGDLVLYPTSGLHRVTPVTRGERLVCVGWVQSLVPDPAQRELLLDLENLRASLRNRLDPQSAELLTLQKVTANLTRMWARVEG